MTEPLTSYRDPARESGGAGSGYSNEPDYGAVGGPDYQPLARDTIPIRSMEESDAQAIIRIDRRITGRNRDAYLNGKVAEALRHSGIRVSLVAEADGHVTGFIMARVDFGEFGQTATTAVIDTIGVDPGVSGSRVGTALVSQLLNNLSSLRVETVRTEVEWQDFGLNRFLARCGFRPAQLLAFSRPI